MRALSLILSLTAFMLPLRSLSVEFSPSLMLTGGKLKACSSTSTLYCHSDAITFFEQQSSYKTLPEYAINKQTLQALESATFWSESAQSQRARSSVISTLKQIQAERSTDTLNRGQLNTWLVNYKLSSTLLALPDNHFDQFIDYLEQPLVDADGNRKIEYPDLARTEHAASTQIYTRFVQEAAKKRAAKRVDSAAEKPFILVITASARDPFEPVDLYTGLLQQAGANVEWLPIDATLQAAWQQAKQTGDLTAACHQLPTLRQTVQGSAARERIYPDLTQQQYQLCLQPELLSQKIAAADGVFINDGNRQLLLHAFNDSQGKPYPILRQIREQLASNKLILASSDARVLADHHPTTQQTLQQASHNTAKLGLFNQGLIETGWKKRNNPEKLRRQLAASNQQWAFGIAKTTALLIGWNKSEGKKTDDQTSTLHFSVIGEYGVLILNKNNEHTSHYLTTGDSGSIIKQGKEARLVVEKL